MHRHICKHSSGNTSRCAVFEGVGHRLFQACSASCETVRIVLLAEGFWPDAWDADAWNAWRFSKLGVPYWGRIVRESYWGRGGGGAGSPVSQTPILRRDISPGRGWHTLCLPVAWRQQPLILLTPLYNPLKPLLWPLYPLYRKTRRCKY